MSAAARVAVAALVVAALGGGSPAAADDRGPSRSAYAQSGTFGDGEQRAARHEALAAEAARAGDLASEARHTALACVWRVGLLLDPRMQVPPCPRARELAARAPLDVRLLLDEQAAELAAWMIDVDATVATMRGILDRGAALDPLAPDSFPVRRAWLVLGAVLVEAGRFDEGLAALEEGLRVAEAAGDAMLTGFAHLTLCRAHDLLGDLARARDECARARAVADAGGDWYLDLRLSFTEGEVTEQAGDPDAALALYQHALALARQPGGATLWIHAADAIASLQMERGQLADARATLEALQRDAPPPMLWLFRALWQHQWGKLLLHEGDLDGAAAAFAVSRETREQDVAIWGWRDLALVRIRQGDPAAAQAALEEAIARLEAGRLNVGGASSRASYLELHARLYGDLVGVLWDRGGAGAAPAALAVAEAGRARALKDALAAADVAGRAAPALDAAAVQALLADDEVLVEYVASGDRLFAITATRAQVAIAPLPAAGSPEVLAQRVAFFRQLVAEAPDLATLAPAGARLYQDLLAPALAAAPPAARTLIISGDGAVRELPWDALVVDGAPLVARWQLAEVPSAAVLGARAAAAAPSRRALVVAASESALPPLPATRAEAAIVRRRIGGAVTTLAGARATEAALAAAGVERYAVLHVASHAEVDPSVPLRSALVLARGDATDDGRWRAEEIYRQSLSADLVVLSACATATGQVKGGEGAMSLARAFLFAGAAATIATRWDLDDAAGPAFADALYPRLTRAATIGDAVAGAKRALLAQGAPPRVWAAYALFGAPARTVRVRPPTTGVPAPSLLFGLGALGLVAIGVRSRRGRAVMAVGAIAASAIAATLWLRRPGPPAAWRWRAPVEVASRGTADASLAVALAADPSLAVALAADGLRWQPVADADGYRLAAFADDGTPIPTPATVSSPAQPPAGARWVRVDATRLSIVRARSSLVALPLAAPPSPPPR